MPFDQTRRRRPCVEAPGSRPAAARDERPGALPDRRLAEERRSSRGGTVCSSPPVRAFDAGEPAQLQQPQLAVLAALQRVAAGEQRRARRAEVGVGHVQLVLIRRASSGASSFDASGESTSTLSPQSVRAVPRAVPGRHHEVAGRRVDGGAVARPDRRVARRAGARDDQPAAIAAERVPDVRDPPRAPRTSSRRAPGRAECRR